MKGKSKVIRISQTAYEEQEFIRQTIGEPSLRALNDKIFHNLFQLISMYHDKDVSLEFEFSVLEHSLKITAIGLTSFILTSSEAELKAKKEKMQKDAQKAVAKARKNLKIKNKSD